MAIQFILCLNKQGVVRLVRWFQPLADYTSSSVVNGGSVASGSLELIAQIYKLVSSRDHKHQSNFVAVSYTHLDVYKRQIHNSVGAENTFFLLIQHVQHVLPAPPECHHKVP